MPEVGLILKNEFHLICDRNKCKDLKKKKSPTSVNVVGGAEGWVQDRMLRIILPSAAERLAVHGEHGTHSCLEFSQPARKHHFVLYRMELPAAKALSAADLSESVSRS